MALSVAAASGISSEGTTNKSNVAIGKCRIDIQLVGTRDKLNNGVTRAIVDMNMSTCTTSDVVITSTTSNSVSTCATINLVNCSE